MRIYCAENMVDKKGPDKTELEKTSVCRIQGLWHREPLGLM